LSLLTISALHGQLPFFIPSTYILTVPVPKLSSSTTLSLAKWIYCPSSRLMNYNLRVVFFLESVNVNDSFHEKFLSQELGLLFLSWLLYVNRQYAEVYLERSLNWAFHKVTINLYCINKYIEWPAIYILQAVEQN
jgi:hypothetical protein